MEQLGKSATSQLPSQDSETDFQIVVTVLRAENLPRYKTSLGKKRDFYVTVTDGVTQRKTTARRSVAQGVQWDEKLKPLSAHLSPSLEFSLYAAKTTGADIFVGKQQIAFRSQNEAAFLLGSSNGISELQKQPVTVYLTITISPNSSSPSVALLNASNTEVFSHESTRIATISATPTFDDHLETPQHTASESLSHQVSKKSSRHSPLLPEGDADAPAKISPEISVNKAAEAMKAISVVDTWKNAVGKIERVMDALSPFAELHPCAKMTWGLLRKIPETYLQQIQRDEDVRSLLMSISDSFDFAQEAETLTNLQPKQAQIVKLMLQHVCNCSDFIAKYAGDAEFRKRLLKNISCEVDLQIKDYRETLKELREKLLDRAAITTEMNTFQILDDVGVVLANVRGISNQVFDLDLDTKVQKLPYKGGWRSDVKRDLLPGTRVPFLDYIGEWVNNPDADRGLVLFGQAGTGKSSIAHEIARRFRDMNRLTSYFVFLRGEQSGRADYLLFTTLIRDLSNRYPSFRKALGATIRNNEYLPTARDYHTLFHDLLLQSLQDLRLVGPILVVIDALDESDDAFGEDGLPSFLAKSVSQLPSEFRILITSRRERAIHRAFATASSVHTIEMTDAVLAATTDEDIRAYLRENLPRNMFDKHGKSLEAKAERLFQWAAVACQYIRQPPPGLTTNDCIKSLLSSTSSVRGLDVLDQLYKDILEGYFKFEYVWPRFRSVMGQLLAASEPLSIASLTSLRAYASDDEADDEESVTAIVGHLGSLLSNVMSTDLSLPVVPLHTSFRDFLTDEKKSRHFHVDLTKAHRDLASYCLGLMVDELRFNMCSLESSYFPNKDVPDINDRINKYITKALSYACKFWDDHMQHFDFNLDLFVKLENLFYSKFLFWLEVLSLTGNVTFAPQALTTLKTWLASGEQTPSNGTVDIFEAFINDASTFLRYFAMPIAKSAPHIYISCLPFAPMSSHVFKRYSVEFPRTLSLQLGRLSHWPALEIVIPAHDKAVFSVAFSPDGQHIVSTSKDHTIRMSNATTGTRVGKAFTGHTDMVHSVSFSPDGQHIVSGSDDRTIRMWNAKTGEMVGEPFAEHSDCVRTVAFSPDGQYVVSGSDDCTICVWNARTGQKVGQPFIGHDDCVRAIAFSPDGHYIASGSADSTIRIWDAKMGRIVGKPFMGHDKMVNSVSFSPDGQYLVSGSRDCTIRIWDVKTGKMVGEPFIGHNNSVWSVSFSPDGQRFASSSSDCTIRMWNVRTGKMVGEPFTGHNNAVWSVSFSPDGQRLASGSSDCTVCIWNAKTGGAIGEPSSGHSDWIRSVSFSPDGQHIVSASDDNTSRMWDVKNGEIVGELFTGHSDWVRSVSFSPDGQYVVSGSDDRTIRIWDAKTGKTLGEPFSGHNDWVRSVSFSPDGHYVISGSDDCTICMWNARTGELVGDPFIGHDRAVSSVSFSPDGRHIVSASHDYTIRLWNAKTGDMAREPFTGHTNAVLSASFSPDGQRIVSGSDDHTIRIWSVGTGEMVGDPFTGHNDSVLSVLFSPDGRHIVSASLDHTICIWDASTGGLVGGPLTGHSDAVTSVSFSPDGWHIVSCSADRTIRIWDTRTADTTSTTSTGDYTSAQSTNGQRVSEEQAIRPPDDAVATEAVPTNTNLHITAHTIINSDGWIYGPDGQLFLWIPQPHRASLHRPSSRLVGGKETRLDFSKFVHGRSWSECRD